MELNNMNETTSITISKEEIAKMPPALFPGRIIVVQNASEARKAVSYLSDFPLLGFDTETRPSFRKGHMHKVSLIQISTEDTCFLFRINQTGFLDPIKELLQNENITKIGLSIHDDFKMLHKLSDFTPQNFVELQQYVKKFNIQDASLQKIYAIVFGKRVSKSQRLSNWEAETLSEAQKKYAATDAWACIEIYKRLRSGKFTRQLREQQRKNVSPTPNSEL